MGAAVPATISRSEVGHRNGGAPMCTRAELQRDRTRSSQAGASFLQPAEGDNKEGTAGKAACSKTCLLRLCGPGLFARTSPEVKVAVPGSAIVYPSADCARQRLAGYWCLPVVDLFGPVLPRGTNTVFSP